MATEQWGRTSVPLIVDDGLYWAEINGRYRPVEVVDGLPYQLEVPGDVRVPVAGLFNLRGPLPKPR